MLRMFRGDKTFLPENLGPPSHIVVSCSYFLFCLCNVQNIQGVSKKVIRL